MLTDYVTVAMNGLKETFDSLQSTLNQMTVETTSEKKKVSFSCSLKKIIMCIGRKNYHFYKASQKCYP